MEEVGALKESRDVNLETEEKTSSSGSDDDAALAEDKGISTVA